MRTIYLLLLVWVAAANAAETESPIRFGLTAVIVTENLRFLDQWSQYLEQKTGHEVEFVLRKSYSEVMDLLVSGEIEFAWICGFPYIQTRTRKSFQLLTVPIYRGEPRYHSYIIVPESSSYKRISDLEGKVFAFSDPDSNSGFLYPLALMADKDQKPQSFFRKTFFTFNHAETVQAVSDQFADGGAVDSYIWEYLAVSRPDITKKTRIIKKSPGFGFPPIVSRSGIDAHLVKAMKNTLENMDQDLTGKSLLSQLKLDGFGSYSDSLFNGIRALASKVQNIGSISYKFSSE
ncbi:MAG: phosphate/phosphite/phosphonate ABC transporter substrate-binding protein [Gammaproteobacteria bacterium]|nr:phosphate/phosphite/phosphonate ABC transporter substrate-binding protein [Gammaproteobacteria bacterium]